jgi:hypothetical protein
MGSDVRAGDEVSEHWGGESDRREEGYKRRRGGRKLGRRLEVCFGILACREKGYPCPYCLVEHIEDASSRFTDILTGNNGTHF